MRQREDFTGTAGRTVAAADGAAAPAAGTPAATQPPVPDRTWPTLIRLFRDYVLPHWRVGVVAILAMLLFSATQVGVVAAIQPLFDRGLAEHDTATIRLYALLFLLLLVLQGIAFFFAHYLSHWIGRRLIKQLRLDVHDRLLIMPNSAFDQLSSGQLISKLTYEAEQTANAVTEGTLTLFKDAVRVIGLLGYMLFLSPWLMLIVAFILPIVGGLIAYINKRFRKLSKRIHRAVGGVGTIAEESVHAHQEIKLFGQSDRERQRFEHFNERNRREFMRFSATKYATVPLVRLIVAIAMALVIALITVDTIVETISVGTIAAFAAAMAMLNEPLKHLVKLNATLQKGLTAARSIFSVIDAEPEPDHGTRSLTRAAGHIEFRSVCFSYDGEREVLHKIDLEILPGETIALTGPSGSGKTTLVNLLPRFYEPSSGALHLDGLPLTDYRMADLRRQIALVGQDVLLFNTTVAGNIAYGCEHEVSLEALRQAAATANALELIESLPQGFDTPVGEDGVLLSGGQRQRLAIARAVLKDAPILILDEATSALDTESEQAIQTALERLMEGRTSLVIAHRLSTVENADRILFLEDGQIVEQGTHRELLAHGGRFAALHQMQFAGQRR
ncbi:lipid A export permease/ATP-binding protein MsbA [Halorhodospira abdelmalekii]|uniref:lipid A export permease/ATP-binding protein MsbA n=1 Tax=Halorhodospira abdelmalekii TaxID=421629 RepID=UPI001902F76B|nr:lipid A export permease/ATP-binding protein MsbA [Halorhodospira abdelmalekii]MBK1734186.1 lipid A export permease/ATP-binding protein MsbA [Halorhodospira abdelmalekii]